MKTLRFRIEGNCPLLMHDDKTANPFNEYTKQLKAISAKRKKTEDDLFEMARVEWTASLYYTEQAGYFIKAECFEATFLAAAKSKKLGTAFKQAVRIPDNPIFHFKHEKLPPEQLFEMDAYKDFRTVKIGTSKILRCRPIYNPKNEKTTLEKRNCKVKAKGRKNEIVQFFDTHKKKNSV